MSKITVVIIRPSTETSGEDAQGNPIVGAPARIPVTRRGALPSFAPRSTTELFSSSGQRVITGGSLYLPAGTSVLPTDRFEIDGDASWQADGEAGAWSNAHTGHGRGVEVAVRRADGWQGAESG